MRPIQPDFFARDPLSCARELIGAELVHGSCVGRILETEAYHEVGDPACHLFTRPSARDFAKRHPPGTAYVYLNYGVHWLVNVLCLEESTGHAGFVLFRALDPIAGVTRMKERRGTDDLRRLCSGPGRLTAALGISGSHHGRSLVCDDAFCLRPCKVSTRIETIADRRVGISAGKDLPWRFLAKDHTGVSVPLGKAR
ncbi:MAG: DNA-3-methyladenine glycosylase [Verrucomicrobiae bacterium]|nr:DNA-3-methyladenine glycosylase [Verrucomicrobiae bacterium]